MNHYLPRELVNRRLAISLQQSYRIVGQGHYGARISSAWVVELLNRARRGFPGDFVLRGIPSDLMTERETAEAFAESGVTTRDLVNWSNRRRNPLPHFRLNSHTRRFRREDVECWMASQAVGGRRSP